jgi:hypothetical protein
MSATPGQQRAPVPGGRLFTPTESLGAPEITYTVSARNKPPELPIMAYLRKNYGNIPLREIDSVFGFVERSTLYGGRGFELNSVICTNDDLARWIRAEYPKYRLDASVIKNIKTHRKIDEALELYDSVVLPMRLNEDLEFLDQVEQKDRIILFANAGCALTCPSKLCYISISEINKGEGGEFKCSQPIKERELYGMVDFPLDPYIAMGFRQFKLLRSRPGGMTGF